MISEGKGYILMAFIFSWILVFFELSIDPMLYSDTVTYSSSSSSFCDEEEDDKEESLGVYET